MEDNIKTLRVISKHIKQEYHSHRHHFSDEIENLIILFGRSLQKAADELEYEHGREIEYLKSIGKYNER